MYGSHEAGQSGRLWVQQRHGDLRRHAREHRRRRGFVRGLRRHRWLGRVPLRLHLHRRDERDFW